MKRAFQFLVFFLVAQILTAASPLNRVRSTNEILKELTTRTNDAVLYVELADTFRSLGKLGKADEQYQRALKIDPKNSDAYNGLSMIHLRQKQYESAEEYSMAAVALKPFNDFYLSQLARARIKLGKTDEAIESLEKAVSLRPRQSAYFFSLLADCYEKKKNFKKAAEIMLQQIPARPWDDTIYVLTARLYYKAEDRTNGDKYKRLAGHMWEDYAEQERQGRVSKAWRLYRSGDYDGALAEFLSLINDEPENPDHYWAAGVISQKMDDLDNAQAYYQKALQKASNHVKAWTGIGEIFELEKDIPRALDAYQHAISADTNDKSPKQFLYKLYMNMQDWTNAISQIVKVTSLDREDHAAWADMGFVESKLKNEPGAFEAYFIAFLDGRTKAEQKKYLKKAVNTVLQIGKDDPSIGRKYAIRLLPWMNKDENDRGLIDKMAGK